MNTEPETEETEVCDRQYCSEIAVGEDRRGIPVCEEHGVEDWAHD